MLLRRLYDEPLAQASYLLGCQRSRQAIVIDPNRDVEQYDAAAAAAGMRITHVTETHIHADFLSGARELASRNGARLLLSAEGGRDWMYRDAALLGATLLRDGDRIEVGDIHLDVWHTPGHTPEHLTFLVTDTSAGSAPMGALTGDFIFVGDVGRPDLLERAAGLADTMERSARDLYRSLQRARTLPDWIQLWPGHGAGSACGKALGAVPQTTLGYEMRMSWAFAAPDEDAFVAEVLAGQPEPPRYFARMKRLNRDGPPPRPTLIPPPFAPPRLRELIDARATVIDLRPAAEYAAGHVPGTISIPYERSFVTWAGSLLDDDRDLWLLGNTGSVARARHDLSLIGIDRVAGSFGLDALEWWAAKEGPLAVLERMDPAALASRIARGAVQVVDVRNRTEWDAGHLPGAVHIPLGTLPERAQELADDRPIVLHCQGGTRSVIASSVLEAAGRGQIADLRGGFGAWAKAGGEIARAAHEVAAGKP